MLIAFCKMPNLPKKTGILLAQLGTPDEATPKAVRRYLKEFLSDRRVVDINPILWFCILNGIILNTRPKKSALLYQRLFAKHGPILRTLSGALKDKLVARFTQTHPDMIVEYGMRYGNPSLKKVLHTMVTTQACTELLIVPLFPQYCSATTASVFDAVFEVQKKIDPNIQIHFLPPFYNSSEYINCVSSLIQGELESPATAPPQKIILSYHGIPERYTDKGDPYSLMCHETTRLIAEKLHYPKNDIIQTYQSRFGKEEWLKPYTNKTLIGLAQQGIKNVMVACPAFTMDCLETLDEIGIENKKEFIENGGENLTLVSCLNDHDIWVNNLCSLIKKEWDRLQATKKSAA